MKLSVLIAGKVEKVNWECRVVLTRLELVDAASDPRFLNFVFVFDLFLFLCRNAAPERLEQKKV